MAYCLNMPKTASIRTRGKPAKYRLLASLLLAGMLGANPHSVEAATYSFTDLGVYGGYGSYSSSANGINNRGQIVGSFWLPGYTAENAMLWQGSSVTNLSAVIGSTSRSSANGINENGAIIGSFGTYAPSATLWRDGSATLLEQPPASRGSGGIAINNAGVMVGRGVTDYSERGMAWNGTALTIYPPVRGNISYLNAINNHNQIVGGSSNSDLGAVFATRWDGTTPVFLHSAQSAGMGINDAGDVVGWAEVPGVVGQRATLWKESGAVDLGTLGGDQSTALAINANGQVVGYSNLSPHGEATHAMLWAEESGLIDLNGLLDAATRSAGWILTDARDINDGGWIVGQAYNVQSDVWHAYRLAVRADSTVPEPGSWALVLLGVGMFGWRGRRRRAM